MLYLKLLELLNNRKFREIEKTLGMLLVPEDLRTNKNDEFSIHLEIW